MLCEKCGNNVVEKYGSGRFCGVTCARSFSTKNKRKEINIKIGLKLKGKKLSEEHKKKIIHYAPKTLKLCLNCHTEMLLVPSDNRKFCNSKCWVEYTEKNKEQFILYRQRCNFDFDINEYKDKFDLSLVEQHGWYSPSNKGNNLKGVSKDHMFSVRSGFEANVNPELIKHPANCMIMLHSENQKKNSKSSITLDELMKRIKNWNSK